MRKIYLFASLLLMGATVFAQEAPLNHKLAKMTNPNGTVTKPSSSLRHVQPGGNHSAAVIWSSDFSNPADWSMTAETGSDTWIIDNVGPVGSFSIGPINSTSAANGWATFDSDNLCSTDQIADLTNATAINCTGHPNVNLIYQEYYRRWYDSTYVFVSNDNVNWTQYSVHSTFANNAATANPTTVTINISAVAGNQATVWIRFQFYSPNTLGPNAGCGYAWEIDDVSVEDIPADDIAIVPSFPTKYADIPLSQVQPIPLTCRINNLGGTVETSVGFDAYVFEIHGGVPTLVLGPVASSTQASLNPTDTTTTTLSSGSFTPTDTGVYAFMYIATMTNTDSNGANDTLLNFIIVDDSMYAKDYTDIDGIINNALGFNTSAGKLANVFEVFSPRAVTSVTFFLGAATVGDTVSCNVYSVTGAGIPNASMGATANHIINTNDTLNWVTLPFAVPVNVTTGKFAIVLNQISAVDNIALGFDNNIFTPNSAFYKIGTGAWTASETGGFPGAFVLRPNLNFSTVSVEETEYSRNIMIYPNPANNKVYIHNANASTSNYTISIFNNLGAVVYTKAFDSFVNAVIDVDGFSNGAYTMQLKSNDNLITKSLMISNN